MLFFFRYRRDSSSPFQEEYLPARGTNEAWGLFYKLNPEATNVDLVWVTWPTF